MDIELKVYFRYVDDQDFELLEFKSIEESYTGKEFKYVIGTLSLQRLYALRDKLLTMNAFLIRI